MAKKAGIASAADSGKLDPQLVSTSAADLSKKAAPSKGGRGGDCEKNLYRTKIFSITIDYEVETRAGKSRQQVQLPGNVEVLVTEMKLAGKVRKAINEHLEPECGKPPQQTRMLMLVAEDAGDTDAEAPACCYYVNGTWICW